SQLGEADRQLLGGVDHLAMAKLEGGAPLLPPGIEVGLIVRPAQLRLKLLMDVVELECRVLLVPAEYLQRGKIAVVGTVGEVGEADLPVVALTETGNEQQVVLVPALPLGGIVGGALAEDELPEDAPHCHHGEAL